MALFPRLVRYLSTTTTARTTPLLYESEVRSTATLQLLTWGRGSAGQLGSGKEEIRYYPSPTATLLLPSSYRLSPSPGRLPGEDGDEGEVEVGISAGLFHSAVVVDGGLWVWGKGEGGRLGVGHEKPAFVPIRNGNVEGVRSVGLGGVHSAVVTTDGEVYTWGYGGFGALGHSVYHRELLPRLVHGDWNGRISHLSTGGAHTAVVSDTGDVHTWGRDEGDGRLGLGSGGGLGEGGAFAVPSKVSSLPVPVKAVACGGFFTMALTSEGKLWSWGANSNFELGRGNNISDWHPQLILALDNVCVSQVACGGYHSLALTDEGKVLSWGHGGHGQLGHHSLKNQEVPLVIESLAGENVVYVSCGGSSSAAVTNKGKLYMWGNARDCQLGVPGLPDTQPLPVEVKFLREDDELGCYHVLSVAVGASHAMCLVLRQNT